MEYIPKPQKGRDQRRTQGFRKRDFISMKHQFKRNTMQDNNAPLTERKLFKISFFLKLNPDVNIFSRSRILAL